MPPMTRHQCRRVAPNIVGRISRKNSFVDHVNDREIEINQVDTIVDCTDRAGVLDDGAGVVTY